MSSRRGGGPAGPAGSGGPPGNAGARGALLLAVAVVLGIVLLQQFDSGIDAGGQVAVDTSVPVDDEDETTTTRRPGLTTVPATATTTAPARAKGDVRVLVANGSGIPRAAGNVSTFLRGLGWATLTPVDATATVEKTAVQFADGYEAEGREVAANLSLPGGVVVPMASPPVAAADLGNASVIVILGTDAPTLGSSTTTAGGGASTTSTTRRP
ncbi:MAG TPA: LytR C-terminal domain-containing protein [Acidimicrobiales bacterium]|nr:LytR C-terminal domain-containing protein [Acidimicrobiales bacterium]